VRGLFIQSAFELLARGRQLADKLGVGLSCVLMGSRVESNAACLIERGADVVYVIDDPALSWFLPGLYSRALVRLIQRREAGDSHCCGHNLRTYSNADCSGQAWNRLDC
jgi:electron transfer flavoprotein alpha subunit